MARNCISTGRSFFVRIDTIFVFYDSPWCEIIWFIVFLSSASHNSWRVITEINLIGSFLSRGIQSMIAKWRGCIKYFDIAIHVTDSYIFWVFRNLNRQGLRVASMTISLENFICSCVVEADNFLTWTCRYEDWIIWSPVDLLNWLDMRDSFLQAPGLYLRNKTNQNKQMDDSHKREYGIVL